MVYFHRVANMRHRSNAIHTLHTAEGNPVGGVDMMNHVCNYFCQIFDRIEYNKISFLLEAWGMQGDLQNLVGYFMEEKIKKAIWDLCYDKAPRLNGFPIFFFCIFRVVIKHDILELFRDVDIS